MVKQSLDRPRGFQEVEASKFHDSAKVLSHTHWPPLPPSKHACYPFLLEAKLTPGP